MHKDLILKNVLEKHFDVRLSRFAFLMGTPMNNSNPPPKKEEKNQQK